MEGRGPGAVKILDQSSSFGETVLKYRLAIEEKFGKRQPDIDEAFRTISKIGTEHPQALSNVLLCYSVFLDTRDPDNIRCVFESPAAIRCMAMVEREVYRRIDMTAQVTATGQRSNPQGDNNFRLFMERISKLLVYPEVRAYIEAMGTSFPIDPKSTASRDEQTAMAILSDFAMIFGKMEDPRAAAMILKKTLDSMPAIYANMVNGTKAHVENLNAIRTAYKDDAPEHNIVDCQDALLQIISELTGAADTLIRYGRDGERAITNLTGMVINYNKQRGTVPLRFATRLLKELKEIGDAYGPAMIVDIAESISNRVNSPDPEANMFRRDIWDGVEDMLEARALNAGRTQDGKPGKYYRPELLMNSFDMMCEIYTPKPPEGSGSEAQS